LIYGVKESRMSRVVEEIADCSRCGLCAERRNPVPGEGDLSSPVVFIGEAPGRKEDEMGRPFVGSAGKMLDSLLSHVGLEREQVYVTNVVKCRPPGNRRPLKGEIRECTRYLNEQLMILTPRVLAPMGNSAAGHVLRRFQLERSSIGEIHGRRFDVDAPWGRVAVYPFYHPAAVLYNRKLEPELRKDFEGLLELLG